MAPINVMVEYAQLVVRKSILENTIAAHQAQGCTDAELLERNIEELNQVKVDITVFRFSNTLPPYTP